MAIICIFEYQSIKTLLNDLKSLKKADETKKTNTLLISDSRFVEYLLKRYSTYGEIATMWRGRWVVWITLDSSFSKTK